MDLNKRNYRIEKSNCNFRSAPGDDLTFARISSNANGLSIDRVVFTDLPVVEIHGMRCRRATLVQDMRNDPNDDNCLIVTVIDVACPRTSGY